MLLGTPVKIVMVTTTEIHLVKVALIMNLETGLSVLWHKEAVNA